MELEPSTVCLVSLSVKVCGIQSKVDSAIALCPSASMVFLLSAFLPLDPNSF